MRYLSGNTCSALTAVLCQIMTLITFIRADGPGCVFTHQIKDHPARAKLTKLAGQRYSTSDNMDVYTYSIGICVDAVDPLVSSLPKAGIVQRKKDNPKASAIVVGKYNMANFMAGNSWIVLEYLGGEKYAGKCNNESRRGSIMILCDPNEDQGSLQLVEENTNKNSECYFLFELTHSAVCSAEKIAAQGLSAGSIFVIVFSTLTGMYLLVGFLYQRFVAGAKGWEQMPHHSFWQDFGNLLADGCDLVCRSGSRRMTMNSTPASREYKGLGDDQLQDDEFDRDEHLLPM